MTEASKTSYYKGCVDLEQKYSKLLKDSVKGLQLVSDKKIQKEGVDAFYGSIKIDFKWVTNEPMVEVLQKDLTTWCTKKHDGNILIWFIDPEKKLDWCYYLKDLVKVRRELLDAKKEPYKVKATGTTLFWMSSWLSYPTEVRRPFKIDWDRLTL